MKQKIIAALITLTIVFSPIVSPVPTVYATGIFTFDFSNFLQNLWSDFLQPALLNSLRREILDRVVDQIISYIQGGGKPKFVTDWKRFIEDAGQGAAGDFAKSLGAGFLCSPFNLQVQLALFPVQKFSQQAQCTLKQIVGNIQNFYNDFRNGGWIAFGASWQPQNNFVGALLMTAEQLDIVKSKAAAKAYNEALASGGFVGAKDKNGNIITPGKTLSDLTSKAAGADIDFVLLAQDYGSAIVGALINRLLTTGLAAVQSSGTSQQQVNADRAAYDASVVANAFSGEKNAILGNINGTAGPRRQAQSLIDSTIASLNKFIADITKISADLTATGKSVCNNGTSVATIKNQIAADIAQANTTIQQLQTERADNRKILDPLNAAIAEINQLTPSRASLTRLDEINSEISPSLDDAAANAFLASTQTETAPINQDITSKTAAYNQQLKQC